MATARVEEIAGPTEYERKSYWPRNRRDANFSILCNSCGVQACLGRRNPTLTRHTTNYCRPRRTVRHMGAKDLNLEQKEKESQGQLAME